MCAPSMASVAAATTGGICTVFWPYGKRRKRMIADTITERFWMASEYLTTICFLSSDQRRRKKERDKRKKDRLWMREEEPTQEPTTVPKRAQMTFSEKTWRLTGKRVDGKRRDKM